MRNKIEIDKYQALYIALLIAVGFLIYANTLHAPFIFDDERMIKNNPAIRMQALGWRNIIEAVSGFGQNRPVSTLSFALNYYVSQYNLPSYHIVNISVHIVTGILLFFFLKTTLTISNRQNLLAYELDHSGITTLSGLTALLWLASPVQTQSVTYIVQRSNSMAAMFFILALLMYAQGRLAYCKSGNDPDIASGKNPLKNYLQHYHLWYLGCAVAAVLAFGSKENSASLPFFILLYEWYFFQNLSKKWIGRQLLIAAAILLLFGGIVLIHLGLDPWEKFKTLRDFSEGRFTMGERLLTQTRVVIYYLSLIFFPHPSRQNLDYDFPLSVSLFEPATTALSAIGLIGLIAGGILLAKKQRLISFSIFWFLGNLVIESSIIPLAIIFEHRLYLPSMLVWLVPIILIRRYNKSRRLITGIGCVLLILFSYWTFERNKVWRSAVTLWTDCAKKSPDKARIYSNLAEAQSEQNMVAEARQNIDKALALDPNSAETHYNLGRLLEDEGQTDAAILHYRQAIALNPAFVPALNNLGVALLDQGEIDESIKHFNQSLRIEPKFALTHGNLGFAKFKQGKLDEAIVHYSKSVELNPNLAKTQFNLGVALMSKGQSQQGIRHIRKALKIDPDYADAHNNLGGHLLSQNKTDEAFEHLTRAIRINPDLAQAHNNLGIISIRQGKLAAAISHFQDALSIDPEFMQAQSNLQRALAIRQGMNTEIGMIQKKIDTGSEDPELHLKLGNLYLGSGEFKRAIGEFEKALMLQPTHLAAQNNLAMAYAADHQYPQALEAFNKLIELDPGNSGNYYNIAVLFALQNQVSESIAWLKKAIERGYRNWELIKTDQDLANIRNSEDYKQLIKGH